MALNAEWHAQRQQRRQVAAQRQRQVQANLDRVRQQLRSQATESRHELKQFRDQLLQDGAQRKQSAVEHRSHRLESRLQLQQETQAFLDSVREQRQTQAVDVAQQLTAFAQSIQQQTTQFLVAAHAERSRLAQRLAQDLSHVRINLSDEVSRLRQNFHLLLEEMAEDTEARRLSVHHQLHVIHQQRVINHMRTTEALMTFVETLHLSVQDLLQQMTIDRQAKAVEVQQTLSHHRATRQADVAALFEDLAAFRDQLHRQRTNLQAIVWGHSAVELEAEPNKTGSAVIPQPIVVSVTAPPPATPQPNVIPQESLVQSTPAIPVIPSSKSLLDELADVEKQVYIHIQRVKGARLVEIEAVVGLNRFQAVDALRSLMKRGLVMQRDRIYSIQEDMTL